MWRLFNHQKLPLVVDDAGGKAANKGAGCEDVAEMAGTTAGAVTANDETDDVLVAVSVVDSRSTKKYTSAPITSNAAAPIARYAHNGRPLLLSAAISPPVEA